MQKAAKYDYDASLDNKESDRICRIPDRGIAMLQDALYRSSVGNAGGRNTGRQGSRRRWNGSWGCHIALCKLFFLLEGCIYDWSLIEFKSGAIGVGNKETEYKDVDENGHDNGLAHHLDPHVESSRPSL